MTRTALILGPSGRFGRHAQRAFEVAGWRTRPFDRKTDDLMQAARGADVIVAGWNPEYQHWARLVPGLHARIRKAALANDATVVLPGNVYVFGAQTPGPWSETTPHRAQNPLGRIRRDMEAAYRADGVRTILLRAGDFIDTQASGNWLDRIMLPTLPKGRLTYPGNPGIPHAWAFLPDAARAAVMLAERRDALARFEDVPFPGFTLSGNEMAAILSEVLGRQIAARRMAWWPLQFARPFMPMIGHLFEMRYLWDLPHRLDGAKFAQLLPDFAHTPPAEALRRALPADIRPDQPVPARADDNVMA